MGRVLGLDFGTRRVGAALSDPGGRSPRPWKSTSAAIPPEMPGITRSWSASTRSTRSSSACPCTPAAGRGLPWRSLAPTCGDRLAESTGLPVVFL